LGRDATALEIYLPNISGARTIDVQGLMPGEQIEILSLSSSRTAAWWPFNNGK
jgi:hypothetical protein